MTEEKLGRALFIEMLSSSGVEVEDCMAEWRVMPESLRKRYYMRARRLLSFEGDA